MNSLLIKENRLTLAAHETKRQSFGCCNRSTNQGELCVGILYLS
jgi:hypothetical protein